MEFTHHHYWLKNKNPLFAGDRFVYATGPSGGGSTPGGPGGPTTADDSGTPATATPAEAREREEEELEEGRNKATIQKLDRLTAEAKISGPTAEQAKEGLAAHDHHMRSLSRMLANQEINEDIFGLAYDCLDSSSSTRKAVGRKLVAGKVTRSNFENVLDDLDSGDEYRVPLSRRFAHGRIDQEEYERARDGLNDADPDIVRASQMLSMGMMEPGQFRQELNMAERQRAEAETRAERQTDPVSATQKKTHDQIVDLMLRVGVVIEQLPEEERTRPLLRLQRNLEALNNKDGANRSAISAYMKKLMEDENLSPEHAAEIRGFDAKTKEDFKPFKKRLEAMGLSASAVKNVLKLKREEWIIENEFIKQNKITNDILSALKSQLHYETLKNRMLAKASEMSGINIKEGTQIQYIYPDQTTGNIRTMKINKVEVVDAPILDGMGEDAKPIGRQPANIIIHLDSGERYNIGRFQKWVDSADVHETILSQAQLEQSLGLPEVGMTLKAGQKLDYRTGYTRDSKGNIIPKRDQVEIVSIGDGGVILNEPVTMLTPEQAPHAGLTSPRMSREMNLGEFAKWSRRNEMVPQINTLSQLQDHLRQHNSVLNNQRGRNPDAYQPIRVEPGEVVQLGDFLPDHTTQQLQIKSADDDGVTFADGTKMTLPQFLGFVRKNSVERSNPTDVADRAGDAAKKAGLPKPEQNDTKESWLKKMLKSFENKTTPNENGETFFQKINPFTAETKGLVQNTREVLAQYTFVSLMDIWKLIKEIWEFLKRKHERKSRSRYGTIGSNLPFNLGTEFQRVQQAAENEEVNLYKEAMEQWGTWEVLDRLHETNINDEAKACFIVLTEKGELRWDDMKMWDTLNRLTSKYTPDGASLYIKLTHELQKDPRTGAMVSGQDRCKDAMDALWGEGQWSSWFSQNINAYNSNKSAFEYKGKQLEADPKGTGGLNGELKRLLSDWKKGNYVNPIEYEELIDFAIKYGKLSSEGKMFFLMEGVTAKCPSGPMKGMTLLHMDRLGDLDGQYLNVFPMLDFFTNKNKKPLHPKYLSGEVSKPPEGGYKVEDLEAFRDAYFNKESNDCEAGKQFSQFLWEWMIVDPNFRKRLSKGLRHAENMDHDDAHLFIPPATMEEIKTFTGSVTGTQKFFTNEGYKNGYPGYSQFLISLSNRHEDLMAKKDANQPISDDVFNENEEQMMGALQGYYLFDAYMTGRKDQTDDRRARLDEMHYNDEPVVDPTFRVKEHQAQMDSLMKEVCEAYGIPWKELQLFDYKPRYNEKDKQSQLAANMEDFLQNLLPQAIKKQGSKKMYDIIERRKNKARVSDAASRDVNALRGMAGSNRLLNF